MLALRTVVLSALAGSIMHVSLRLARGQTRVPTRPNRSKHVPNHVPNYVDANDVLALVAATRRALQTLPASGFRPSAARKIDRMASALIADFEEAETHGIGMAARLMERELDARLKVLELALAHQTASLKSLSDSTAHTESAVSCLAREVENLCEKLAFRAPAPSSSPSVAVVRYQPPVAAVVPEERRISRPVASRQAEGVFALAELEAGSGLPAKNERFVDRTQCPTCHSRQTRPAHRFTFLDDCLRLFAFNPWRCRACGARFYRVIWGVSGKPLETPGRAWETALGRLARLARTGKAPQPENLA